ncbi:outer membrane transport energization protein ExbD [Halothece sp. PCC 7418]|uniref:ExbD/TolR family protein n=1 Tax=Halothece sp. (strain PCC 7418) TaxID=65093 RepID=UPI0002A0705D|nr:biopolymer transporter ExbD [Halothece sp. PCC 7418]AFZ42410.1 outer membrane transport energization protein ExbD [Halothece sp. PCC 7418]
MQIPNEPDQNLEINILPMIDVIFSILAFFIISTLFLTRSQGLPVDLPQANTAQQQSKIEVTVTIQANGKLALNQEEISIQKLVPAVQQMSENSQETIIIVKADKAVSHGGVVNVMDQLRQVEGVKLAIATTNPSKSD